MAETHRQRENASGFPAGGRDLLYLFLIAFFSLALLVTRVLLSGGLELDESEQMVLTQAWRWGYGPQPPLYVWLQSLFFGLFGVSIFSLALLKNALLFLTYFLLFRIARDILGDVRLAGMAALALFLSPQYGWEFSRTLTHTVLATALAVTLLAIVLDLKKGPTTLKYTAMGAVAGLGLLAKYNFALLPGALFLAGLSLPGWRRITADRRIFLSIAAAAVVFSGHALWIMRNTESAVSFARKMEISQDPGLTGYIQGTLDLVVAAVGLFWPLLLVYLLILLPLGQSGQPETRGGEVQALLGRTMAVVLGFCLAVVLITELTRFNDRWLAPLLFFFPVFMMAKYGHRITKRGHAVFVSLVVLIMVLTLVLFAGRVLMASRIGEATRFNHPYGALSGLIRESGFQKGNIFAEDHRVGGNLRLHLPETSVNIPGRPPVPLLENSPLLVAWDASREEKIPPSLLDLVKTETGKTGLCENAGFIEAPMLHFEKKMFRLGFCVVDDEQEGRRDGGMTERQDDWMRERLNEKASSRLDDWTIGRLID